MDTPVKHPCRLLVRGCGDMGSAVAHRLYLPGAVLIVHDAPAPHHLGTGMAATDALFDGSVVLERVPARRAEGIQAFRQLPIAGSF